VFSRTSRIVFGRRRAVGWSITGVLLAACTAAAVPGSMPASPGSVASAAPTAWSSGSTVTSSTEPVAPSAASSDRPCPRLTGESVEDRVVARIPIARPGTRDAPWALAIGGGSVWVANRGGGLGSVMRIDPGTNKVSSTITLDRKHRGGPGVWNGVAWVGTPSDLVRIELATHEVTKVAPIGVEALYAGEEGLWVVQPEAVSRIDPEAGTPLQTIKLPGAVWPSATAYGEGSLWVVDGEQEVWRIDAERGRVVARVPVGHRATTIDFTDGAIWVAGGGFESGPPSAQCSVVYRIDPATSEVEATVPVGRQGSAVIAAFEGDLWSRPESGVLARIDADTNTVDRVLTGLPRSHITGDLAGGFGSLWVANWTDGTVWRIDP
jgi:DNA-binding beta-propeller fold protein YncE